MERWRHVEEIFHQALHRDPEDREAFARDACRGDRELFREVSSLLANHVDAGDAEFQPWAACAAARLAVNQTHFKPGKELGPSRSYSFLAAGGMGEVYRATD